jgi:hypothetical protein
MEWQPIETAPKNERVIIRCSGDRMAVALSSDLPLVGNGWHVSVPCMGGYGSGTDTFIHWKSDQPTHWMPLPDFSKPNS